MEAFRISTFDVRLWKDFNYKTRRAKQFHLLSNSVSQRGELNHVLMHVQQPIHKITLHWAVVTSLSMFLSDKAPSTSSNTPWLNAGDYEHGGGGCGVGGSCWPDPRLNCQPLSLRDSPPASLCTSTSATTLVSGSRSCFIYLLSSFCHPAFKPNPLSSEPSDLPVVVVRLFLSYSVVVCGADQSPRQVRACLHASWMALSSMVSACWHPRRTGGRLTVWVVWKGGVSTWRRPFWCCVTRVAREPHWTGLNRVHLENKVMHSIA